MKRFLRTFVLALAGLVLAVGLTAGAYAIGGRDLSKPARPFKLSNDGGRGLQQQIDREQEKVEPDDSPSPEDRESPDDKSGSDSGSSNSGSGSSNSGSGSSNSGSGSSGSGSGDDD